MRKIRVAASRGHGPGAIPTCPVQRVIEGLCKRLVRDRSGEVAAYIPELGKANPEWFGACLVTADGKTYEVGETQQVFTIQSISKPFVYGMAIEDNGEAEVLKKIWLEPSGEAFNAISLRPGQGQPDNPMINAGAIATTSLVEGETTRQKIRRILDGIGRGRPLGVDESVYLLSADRFVPAQPRTPHQPCRKKTRDHPSSLDGKSRPQFGAAHFLHQNGNREVEFIGKWQKLQDGAHSVGHDVKREQPTTQIVFKRV